MARRTDIIVLHMHQLPSFANKAICPIQMSIFTLKQKFDNKLSLKMNHCKSSNPTFKSTLLRKNSLNASINIKIEFSIAHISTTKHNLSFKLSAIVFYDKTLGYELLFSNFS